MIVFAIGVAWVGYTLALYGYGMVKGYDVSFTQMVSPSSYYTGAWPPCQSPDTTIFPGGSCAQGATKTASPSQPTGANAANPAGGAVKSGAPQPGVQGVTAGGHGR